MEFGVSSACLYPALTEDAVLNLAQAGVKNFEIFINSHSEISKDFSNKLKSIINYYGLNIISIHPYTSFSEPFMFFSDYERRFLDEIENYKKYFDFMNSINSKILIFHGDRKESSLPNNIYFERFNTLLNVAKQYCVIVAQENVARCKSSELNFIKQMKDALPEVSFVLDVKQTIRSKIDTIELLNIMGSNLKHIHISDNNVNYDCLPIKKGSFDFINFFNELKKINYNEAVILELYRSNFNKIDDLIFSLKEMVNLHKNC